MYIPMTCVYIPFHELSAALEDTSREMQSVAVTGKNE